MLTFVTGILSALATIALVALIRAVYALFFAGETGLGVASLAWWHILLAPAVGGLIVGLLLRWLSPGTGYQGVSDVMEASAVHSGHIDLRNGFSSALATVVSLGSGAALGREGPAIHLCATINAWLASSLRLNRQDALVLLGCGAAAAVTASFNAPIAGVLFALEVVVGYYSLRVLTPTVISAIAAVIVTRQLLGDSPAFHLPAYAIASLWELPAFALLGVVAGVVSLALIYSVRFVQIGWEWVSCPRWLRPMFAGLLVGVIALQFPLVLGVGYPATDLALREALPVLLLFMLLFAKLLATSVCLGSGFAGGIFSPALFIGAMLGGAFWWLAAGLFPHLASSQGVYSIVGMAGVASALLGAPISTLLIIFELTADYHLVIAVMLTSAIASTLMQYSPCKSFFRWQLEQRGINLNLGRNQSLLMSITIDKLVTQNFGRIDCTRSVGEARRQLLENHTGILVVFGDGQFMGSLASIRLAPASLVSTPSDSSSDATLETYISDPAFSVTANTSLNGALQLLDQWQLNCVPVLTDSGGEREVLGVVYRGDILRAHNEALCRARDEEYGVN